jgi:thiamine pyrophosphokinase
VIWSDFIQTLAQHQAVDLVGPLVNCWRPSKRPVLFIDGGAEFKSPLASISASVGDGDSTTLAMDLLLARDKDYSDFDFALRSLPQNVVEIFAYGFIGGRRDHELANLGEAHAFLKARLNKTEIIFDHGITMMSAGKWTCRCVGIFSVLVLESCRVSITGKATYQILKPSLLPPLSSFGLSNLGAGDIQVSCEGPLILIRSEPAPLS